VLGVLLRREPSALSQPNMCVTSARARNAGAEQTQFVRRARQELSQRDGVLRRKRNSSKRTHRPPAVMPKTRFCTRGRRRTNPTASGRCRSGRLGAASRCRDKSRCRELAPGQAGFGAETGFSWGEERGASACVRVESGAPLSLRSRLGRAFRSAAPLCLDFQRRIRRICMPLETGPAVGRTPHISKKLACRTWFQRGRDLPRFPPARICRKREKSSQVGYCYRLKYPGEARDWQRGRGAWRQRVGFRPRV
jgi:hypothetical protein